VTRGGGKGHGQGRVRRKSMRMERVRRKRVRSGGWEMVDGCIRVVVWNKKIKCR
jgi:hypothetical protein